MPAGVARRRPDRGAAVGKRIVVNAGLTKPGSPSRTVTSSPSSTSSAHRRRSIVGSIYKGVGHQRPARHAGRVRRHRAQPRTPSSTPGDYTANLGDGRTRRAPAEEDDDADVDARGRGRGDEEPAPRRRTAPIEEMLRKGQEVLVQVSKESLGHQGRARHVVHLAFPGRYVVYMPQARHVGVSRRIHDERERERLRGIVKRPAPADRAASSCGPIAEGKGEEEFAADIQFLSRLWAQVQARFEHGQGARRCSTRRWISPSGWCATSSRPRSTSSSSTAAEAYEKCLRVRRRRWCPQLADRVKLYDERRADLRGHRASRRRSRRRCAGGSGSSPAATSSSTTPRRWSPSTSTPASTWASATSRRRCSRSTWRRSTEVVRQIRLRDLGGIIIIDFIDMERAEHREQVYKALKRALADDKARTNVLEISELGLVEMTRKRVRQDLCVAALRSRARPARAAGVVKSDATLAAEIFRKIQAKAAAEAAPAEGRGHGARPSRHRPASPRRRPARRPRAAAGRPRAEDHGPGGAGPSHREQYELPSSSADGRDRDSTLAHQPRPSSSAELRAGRPQGRPRRR